MRHIFRQLFLHALHHDLPAIDPSHLFLLLASLVLVLGLLLPPLLRVFLALFLTPLFFTARLLLLGVFDGIFDVFLFLLVIAGAIAGWPGARCQAVQGGPGLICGGKAGVDDALEFGGARVDRDEVERAEVPEVLQDLCQDRGGHVP